MTSTATVIRRPERPIHPIAAFDADDMPIRVLVVTCEWPTAENPHGVPFIVRHVEFLRRAGVDIDVFSFRGAKKLTNYMRAWRDLRKTVRENKYDLIHAHWGQSGFLATIPKMLPLVVTFRGSEAEGLVGDDGKYTYEGYIVRAISYWVAKRTDELILVSAHIRDYMPDRPVHVIPSGLDFDRLPVLDQTEARERLGLPLSKRLVLFVGDPSEARKRFALSQDVVARLAPELNAELVVAWDVPHSDIPIYMSACDALLFTSMYEGSPNVVKEALACNLPVVSVGVADVPERLKDVEGCAVSADERPETLAVELARVLERRQRINGRAAVRDLDERVLTQRVIQIYRTLMSRRDVVR